MVLFSIPDIRLFWSEDSRFTNQFKLNTINKFKPYSKFPPCYKDFSFWIPAPATPTTTTATTTAANSSTVEAVTERETFHENDFCEIVRDVAGDLVEGVELVSCSFNY